MWSKPADLITAWLIAAVLLGSIAIAPVVQFRDPPFAHPSAVRDVSAQRFDLKTPDAVVRHGVETPLTRERGNGDERQANRRVIDVSFER